MLYIQLEIIKNRVSSTKGEYNCYESLGDNSQIVSSKPTFDHTPRVNPALDLLPVDLHKGVASNHGKRNKTLIGGWTDR